MLAVLSCQAKWWLMVMVGIGTMWLWPVSMVVSQSDMGCKWWVALSGHQLVWGVLGSPSCPPSTCVIWVPCMWTVDGTASHMGNIGLCFVLQSKWLEQVKTCFPSECSNRFVPEQCCLDNRFKYCGDVFVLCYCYHFFSDLSKFRFFITSSIADLFLSILW